MEKTNKQKKRTRPPPKIVPYTFSDLYFSGTFKNSKGLILLYFKVQSETLLFCRASEQASGVPPSHSMLQAAPRLREAAVLSKCNSPSSTACHTGVNIQIKSHQCQTRLLQFNMGASMTLGWGAAQRVTAAKPLTWKKKNKAKKLVAIAVPQLYFTIWKLTFVASGRLIETTSSCLPDVQSVTVLHYVHVLLFFLGDKLLDLLFILRPNARGRSWGNSCSCSFDPFTLGTKRD